MPANLAIDFFPSMFQTSGPQLKGIQAANEGFLHAFLRHAQVDELAGHTRSQQEFQAFAQLARSLRGEQARVVRVAPGQNQLLTRIGALLHPFPGFGPLAWLRRAGPSNAYSLLGITHTTATHAVMDSIGNLSVAPIESWDAVVCTSQSVRATYDTVLHHWREHLVARLGATKFPLPQLPVIPLGVDCDRFPEGDRAAQVRTELRASLGLAADDLVVFWMGRFSHLSKAHPLPSYLALQSLAQRLGRRVVFLQAGWFTSDDEKRAWEDAAARFSRDVRHVFADGRDPRVREQTWAAADIFLSLSDNLQETFGLTPIEAMAAGLPVVVSDWDGYRDTVRDGVDGFRIPTQMPPAGTGADFGFLFATGRLHFAEYCGATALAVSVDLQRCVEALAQLATDADLRRRMGDAGRQRARDLYDWRVVIAQYQALGDELAARRAAPAAKPAPQPAVPLPLRDDPFRVFSSYHTEPLQSGTRLCPGVTPAQAAEPLHAHPLNAVGSPWRLPAPALQQLLAQVRAKPGVEVAALLLPLDLAQRQVVLRTVAWLLKMGLLASREPA